MVEVEVGDATMLLGLTLQTGGTAAEYVKTITKTFHRIEETSAMERDNDEPTSILSRKNTMSDRCITRSDRSDAMGNIQSTLQPSSCRSSIDLQWDGTKNGDGPDLLAPGRSHRTKRRKKKQAKIVRKQHHIDVHGTDIPNPVTRFSLR